MAGLILRLVEQHRPLARFYHAGERAMLRIRGLSQFGFLHLLEVTHVEIAVGFQPVLVGFNRERADQPQATFLVGEDAQHDGSVLDLLVEALEHVGDLHVFVVLTRQWLEGEGLLDVFLAHSVSLG